LEAVSQQRVWAQEKEQEWAQWAREKEVAEE
jgi:hypothetical protein